MTALLAKPQPALIRHRHGVAVARAKSLPFPNEPWHDVQFSEASVAALTADHDPARRRRPSLRGRALSSRDRQSGQNGVTVGIPLERVDPSGDFRSNELR
ncbi:MAG TPA: hypothetical protein VM282_03780 [Acidimicrobiales bacterium]|nr:hypothetical protein [Acidimicrobiales bacterium]